jgi:hypothetical protein
MFADHNKLLSELITEFPVTHQDLVILIQNKSTYHGWLGTYSVERLEGTRNRLKDANDDKWYNSVLSRIEAWFSIVAHSWAAHNIRISGHQGDVYCLLRLRPSDSSEALHSSGFFLSLCLEHVQSAAWQFTDDIPEYMYTDGQTRPARPSVVLHRRVEERTNLFVSRVDEALRRMMTDWTPTVPVYVKTLVRPLDFDSVRQKLSSVLLRESECYTDLGEVHCVEDLKDVYACLGGLVGYLRRPSVIMSAWNSAVRLMMNPPGHDKTMRFNKFIAQLLSATETHSHIGRHIGMTVNPKVG